MTTILYHYGHGIVADRAATAGDDRMPDVRKLYDFDKYVTAICGSVASAVDATNLIERHLTRDRTPLNLYAGDHAIRRMLAPLLKELRELNEFDSGGHDVVLVDREYPGVVLSFSSGPHLLDVIDLRRGRSFEAWGVGADVVKGARAAGADMGDCIRIASELVIGVSVTYDFIRIGARK